MANWQKITEFTFPEADGKSTLASPWHFVIDTFPDVDHVRFEAEGTWSLLPNFTLDCDPDGRSDIPVASEILMLPSCRFGGLIGKIGGSSASIEKPVEGAAAVAGQPVIFAIGKNCILPLKDLPRGPLFVGVNVIFRPLIVSGFKLTVTGATLG